jgi:hypothetical protein
VGAGVVAVGEIVGAVVGVEAGKIVGEGATAVAVGVGGMGVADIAAPVELSGWLTPVQLVRAKATTNNKNKRRVSVAMFTSHK